jgi:hypothetical protein
MSSGRYTPTRIDTNAPRWNWESVDADNIKEENDQSIQHYKSGSKKPGVYLKNTTARFKVKIQVQNNGAAGQFWLCGKLGTLKMKSVAAFAINNNLAWTPHEIEMQFVNWPPHAAHYEGDARWWLEADGSKHRVYIPEESRLELFAIYDNPKPYFDAAHGGVWVEALRLMFKKANVSGLDNPDEISKRVTEYCHSSHGMTYDTERGGPGFNGGNALEGGAFYLKNYIKKEGNNGRGRNVVNCYDQAVAVQVFCGCLGVGIEPLYVAPFGYINTTKLIGVGDCNNPFFSNSSHYSSFHVVEEGGIKSVVTSIKGFFGEGTARSAFGNHAFARVVDSKYIRDACAGPHVGLEKLAQYLTSSIDDSGGISVNFYNRQSGTAIRVTTTAQMHARQRTVRESLWIKLGPKVVL